MTYLIEKKEVVLYGSQRSIHPSTVTRWYKLGLTKSSGLLHVQGAGNIHQLVTHRSFHITGKQPLDHFSAVINSYQCDCQGMGNSHVHGTTCSGRLTATFSGLQKPELQLFHSVAQRVKRKNLNIKLVFTMQYR